MKSDTSERKHSTADNWAGKQESGAEGIAGQLRNRDQVWRQFDCKRVEVCELFLDPYAIAFQQGIERPPHSVVELQDHLCVGLAGSLNLIA
jgi:hypothetical protein